MLVRLYDLPTYNVGGFERDGVKIKRAIAPEMKLICDWVGNHFSKVWKSECWVAFANSPISCFVAYEGQTIVGFACYNATAKDFFGPTGVLDDYRGKGIGKALLLECLYALKHEGYAYAIIGGVGPAEFYKVAVGAELIKHSSPGIYRDLLKEK